MRSLGVIVARAASKRLPNKPLRPLLGHPLIAWTARAALASRLDRVVLSTEDDGIAEAAARYGIEVPFRRPAELAGDYAGSEDIVDHALTWVEKQEGRPYDAVVLIQSTTPFVLPEHIDASLDALETRPDLATAMAARVGQEPPSWLFRIDADGDAHPWLDGEVRGEREHTQFLDRLYIPTGAIYANRIATVRGPQNTVRGVPLKLIEMPRERSIDIDDALDLVIAEAVGRHHGFHLLDLKR